MAAMTSIAFVGLGAMGGRIAGRLLAAGHRLAVWNRTPERTAPLAALGATAAPTPAVAVAGAELVFTMVADPAALRAVTAGPDGIAAGIAPTATAVDLSTVGPAAVAELANALAPATVLDAPVLGSLAEAQAGTLTLFVGGPAAAVDRWAPVLSVLGTVRRVGPSGAGAAAKLVANSTLFGVLGVLGEALALAAALGLSPDAAYQVLAATPLAAQAERRRPAIEAGEFRQRFALSLACKDADLVLAAAEESGVDLRLAAAARSWLADAEAAGRGALDYTAVLAQLTGG
jgi:3-hydroxyisobutyrate dehydrogenase-like beta-hydroxyacid dehydrogenase